MEHLPADVLHSIVLKFNKQEDGFKDKLIGARNILRLCRINKRFNQIYCQNERIWKELFKRDFSDKLPDNVKREYLENLKEFEEMYGVEIYEEAAYKGYEKIMYKLKPEDITRGMILEAVRGGNENTLFYLLDKTESIKENRKSLIRDVIETTIESGNLKLFEKLEDRFDIPIDKRFMSRAIKSGNLDLLKYMENKYNLEIEDKDLEHVSNNSLQIIKYILSKVTISKPEIDKIIRNAANSEIMQYLWPLGTKNIDNLNRAVFNLLKYKRWNNFFIDIKPLLDLGIDIHKNDDLILRSMIKANEFEAIKYLVKRGADVNAEEENGSVMLVEAVFSDNKDIFMYLIENGADVNNIIKIDLIAIKREKPEFYKLILKLKREGKKGKEEKRSYTKSETTNRCIGKTATGQPCKRNATHGEYCFQHCK